LAFLHPQFAQSVAVRVLANHLINAVLENLDSPLFLTSANLSGAPDPQTLREVEQEILSGVDCLAFPGLEISGKPSALVDLRRDPPRVLRTSRTLESLFHD
jgi:tRNA A37 threonylcarbamoyladenosine synthetase subunit TsaC/SUA5/YrdC